MRKLRLDRWLLHVEFDDGRTIEVDLGNIIELALLFGVFALAYNVGQHDATAYHAYWYWYYNEYLQRPDLYANAMQQIVPHYVSVVTTDSVVTGAMPKYNISADYNDEMARSSIGQIEVPRQVTGHS